jgi:outer membrane protein
MSSFRTLVSSFKMIAFFLVFAVVMFSSPVSLFASTSASDTLALNLEDAVRIALGSSPESVRNENQLQLAKWSMSSTKFELFSPSLDLSITAPSYDQSTTEILFPDTTDSDNVLSKWVDSENSRYIGRTTLSQPLPTGTKVRIESYIYKRMSTTIDDEFYNSMTISASHEFLSSSSPILNWKIESLNFKRAELNYNSSMRGLVLHTVELYYSLISSAEELLISYDDLAASEQSAATARRKYGAGLIPEVEALQLEVQLAQKESGYQSDLARYEAELDRFRVALGLDLNQILKITEVPTFDSLDVDLDNSLSKAFVNREEIKQNEINVKLSEYSYKSTKRQWGPSGAVTASYSKNIRDEAWDSVKNASLGDYDVNKGMMISLAYPLFTGGRKNLNIQRGKLNLRQANYESEQTRKQIILEVRDVVRNLEESHNRYKNSLKTLEIARKTYDINRSRFENGQVTAREWIEAQLSLKQNRVSTLRALIDYNLAVARYRVAIGEPVLPFLDN